MIPPTPPDNKLFNMDSEPADVSWKRMKVRTNNIELHNIVNRILLLTGSLRRFLSDSQADC